MISHALTIVLNELNKHLAEYGVENTTNQARLGNLAEGVSASNGDSRNMLVFSIVSIREEKALKNVPNCVRDDRKLSITYENPPVFLNLLVLVSATHESYFNALSMLSRGIRFFQFRNSFTPDNVSPASLTQNAPPNKLDQLESFKLIFDLYSLTMEETNQLWGTLGGKQYPAVLYNVRMLDLKFRAIQQQGTPIREVINEFYQKGRNTN